MKRKMMSMMLACAMILTMLPCEALAAAGGSAESTVAASEAQPGGSWAATLLEPDIGTTETFVAKEMAVVPTLVEDSVESAESVTATIVESKTEARQLIYLASADDGNADTNEDAGGTDDDDEVTEIALGTCGTGLTWVLDSTGTLTIRGTGAMKNYSGGDTVPWHSYLTQIVFVVIEDGVTSIGSGAFQYCPGLTSVTLPRGVTSIGNNAFYYCKGLTSITLPDGLTSIGSYAFYRCYGLTSVTLPEGLTSISGYTFYDCTGLTSVTLPDGLTSIATNAFRNCTRLASVTLPESVKSIGGSAFEDCTGLASITFPEGMTTIGSYAFKNCARLTSITLPESMTSIPEYAFQYCTGLTSVTLPEGLTSIGYNAFRSCTSLRSVTLPATITTWGTHIFEYCTGLTSVTFSEGLTSIGNYTFKGCTKLMSVTLPESVTTVGEGAFYGCTGLTSVTLPGGLTSISNSTFHSCKGLTSLALPEGITSIGGSAFFECSGLTEVSFPEGLTSVGNHAFYGCGKLTTVTLPEGLTFLGGSAFSKCSQLKTVTLPEGVTSIDNFTFEYCGQLRTVTLPKGLKSIGSYAFGSCEKLTSIILPDTVTSIANNAFYSCKGLTSITMPKELTSVGEWAFMLCPALKNVYIGDLTGWCKVSFHDTGSNPFYYADNLYVNGELVTDLVIPDGVTSISRLAFYDCRGLTSVTLPDGLVSIGSAAFSNCTKLESIYIPETVTTIGSGAFSNCSNLTILCMKGSYAETYAVDNNISYSYIISETYSITVTVTDDAGSALTNGYEIYWYPIGGSSLFASGNTISGAEAETEYEYQVVLDDELLMTYYQPERTAVTVGSADAEYTCVLSPRPTVIVTGRVTDEENAAIAGAALVFTQTISGDVSKTVRAATGSDGTFSAVLLADTETLLTVSSDGYYSATRFRSFSDSADLGDIALTALPSNKITLTLTKQGAALPGAQAEIVMLTSTNGLSFTVYNQTQGKTISDVTLQYPYLIVGDGQTAAGDTIRIRAVDETRTVAVAETTVTLDENRCGSATLRFIANGVVTASVGNSSNTLLLIFSGDGAMIDRVVSADGSVISGALPDGTYTAVLMEKTDLLPTVSLLDALSEYRLTAGDDYYITELSVSSGVITNLGNIAVPTLDTNHLLYTVAANTGLFTSTQSTAVGRYVSVRVQYQMDTKYSISNEAVMVEIPTGMEFIRNSVTLDGKSHAYTYENRTLTVNTGSDNGTIRFYVMPTEAGSRTISASLRFILSANTITQPCGSAAVEVSEASITITERTGRTTVPVSGTTVTQSTVRLYDNNVLVLETAANKAGSWSALLPLLNPTNNSVHNIYAEIITSRGVTYSTETVSVTYSEDYCEVERITMYNTAHGSGSLTPLEFVTVFEFLNEDTSRHAYNYWPSYPTFTFVVEMTGNADSVSVVTTNQNGDKTTIECNYDETSGTWIGTQKYTTYASIPCGVSASYTQSLSADTVEMNGSGVATEAGEDASITFDKDTASIAPTASTPFAVSSVNPTVGGTGIVTVAISGKLLEPNAVVALTDGTSSYAARSVYWMHHEKLYATFDLSSAQAGTYNLSVTCGGSGAVLPNCFTVDPTLAAGVLSYEFHMSETVTAGKSFTGYVAATNTGYTDAAAPVVVLVGDNLLMGLAEDTPESEAISVFLQNGNGLAGTLAHGETAFCNFSYSVPETGSFSLKLRGYDGINQSIDYGGSSKSLALTEEQAAKLLSLMGETYPAYATGAAKMANALAPLLDEITLDTILAAYLQNVSGIGNEAMAESAVDLASTDLFIDRKYVGSGMIAGLYGAGWISPYEITAAYASSEGLEMIAVTDTDSMRLYLKNAGGVFVNILSNAESATYDESSGMITVRRQSGETLTFNSDGKLVSDADLYGNAISLTWIDGELTKVSSTDGDSVNFTYTNDKVTRATASTGDTVTYTYSGEYLATATTKYGTTSYTYDNDGKMIRVVYPDGTYIVYGYDSYGRVSEATDGDLTISYAYGLYELTARDSMGHSSRTRYDALGNAIWSIDTANTVSYANYNDDLQLESVSQGLSYSVSYEYDQNGLPILVTLPDGGINSYAYDDFGNIARIIDAKGQTTSYERDSKGNTTAVRYANGGAEIYTYDEKGRVATATTRGGVTASYTYDGAGNITLVSYSSGETLGYAYDKYANVTSITENGKTTTLTYDDRGDLSSVVYPDGKSVSYTYDSVGRRASVSDGEYVTGYTYNAQGLLAAVTDGENTLISYAWNPDGTLSRQTNANGTYTAYGYADGLLTSIANCDASGAVLSSFAYTYDRLGNISTMTDNTGTWRFSYDRLGQLTRAVSPNGSVTDYSYDAAGNRQSVTSDGAVTEYSVNTLNQYTAYGDASRTYDADGNLLAETKDGKTASYQWNYLGQLVKYTDFDGTVYEYGYDAFGLRSSVTVDGATTTYLNDPTGYGYAVASYSGGAATHYALAGGIAASVSGGEAYFYNSNHLGSVTEITGSDGAVVNRYTYDQEGNVLTRIEGVVNPYTYVGIYGIVNDGNGLIYDRARYVSAATDSFISPDPAGQAYDLNVYRYVAGALLSYVDLSGYNIFDDIEKLESPNFSKAVKKYKREIQKTREALQNAEPKTGKKLDVGKAASSAKKIKAANNARKAINTGRVVSATGRIIASGGRNALSGAVIGATVGSIEPGGGTIVGAVGGMIVGAIRGVALQIIIEVGIYAITEMVMPQKAMADSVTTSIHTTVGKNDPSGYVYAGVTSSRLEGVTATVYYEGYPLDEYGEPNTSAGPQTLEWTEAAEYDEVNPQTTDAAGQYGWDVLEGKWRVHFEKDGYDDYWTDWMEVPPEYTDVNVNLQSQTAPEVLSVDAYPEEIRIAYSQYMNIHTVNTGTVSVTVGGVNVTGTVRPVNAESNYEGTAIYASVFRFVPESVLSGEVAVSVTGGSSYSGVVLANAYIQTANVAAKPESLSVADSVYVEYMDGDTVTVQVLPAEAGANVILHVNSSSPSILGVATDTVVTDASGCAAVTVTGRLPGTAELVFTLDSADLSATTKVAVARSAVDEITLDQTHSVIVSNGLGSGVYTAGERVTIRANNPAEGYIFKEWNGVDGLRIMNGDSSAQTVTFIMPSEPVKLAALYESTAAPTYVVTVTNGAGSGSYTAGASVTITANTPETGKRFKEWIGTDGLTFTSGSKAAATVIFTMPANAVSVTATYEDIPATTYTITFNPNGGNVATISAVTDTNGKLNALPTPTRSSYSFNGWYTASSGGTQITVSTVFDSDTTIYAQWTYSGGSGGDGSSGGNSSGGGGGNSNNATPPTTTTETINNSDGSTTTITTQTVTNPDGTKTVTVTTETKMPDGTIGIIVTDGDGNWISAEATVSQVAVDKALADNEPVQVPITVTPVPIDNADSTSAITLTLPELRFDADNRAIGVSKMPKMEIALTRSGPGIVAMLRGADGVLTIIKECYEGSIIFPVEKSCEVIIVDNTKSFSDVAGDIWYSDAVNFVAAREIFNGVGDGLFSPTSTMNRAMIAQVLYNFDRNSTAGIASAFSDIKSSDWYVDAVGWASKNAIVNGYGGSYGAMDAITRQDLVTILYRYAKGAGYDVSAAANLNDFVDGNSVADYAQEAMQWAINWAIIGGYEDETICPTATATRAEVAAIMTRFVRNVR